MASTVLKLDEWLMLCSYTVKSHFIDAQLNGEPCHIKIKKSILMLATFIV